MTTFSEFKERHDLGEDWSVRFTAGEARAREMADQYRLSGYDVRVLPMGPGGQEIDVDAFDTVEVDYNPVREVDGDSCTTCLGDDTYVLVTRRTDETVEDELVY